MPRPGLEYGDLLVLLAGTLLFFRRWEFVECEIWFRRVGLGGGDWEEGMKMKEREREREKGALDLMPLGSARVRNV